MILNIINFLYLCTWATILMLCLQRQICYPIFVNKIATKVFWFFTFIFFNPILSFLYILCAISPAVIDWRNKRKAAGNNSESKDTLQKRNKAIPALAIAATFIVIVFFEIPRPLDSFGPVIKMDKAYGSDITRSGFLKSGLNLGLTEAENKIQTISSKPTKKETEVSFNNIVIICKSKNQFLEQIAQNIQKSLFELSYVNSITYYTGNEVPESDSGQADIYITLEIQKINEDKFLLGRDIDIKINCLASSSITELFDYLKNAKAEPVDSYSITSNLHYISKTISIECPGTEYHLEVKKISSILSDALKNQFENLMQNASKSPEK